VSAHAQALTAAFPGETVSRATCLALVADVHRRLMPEVTVRVTQHQAERWLEACTTAKYAEVDDLVAAVDGLWVRHEALAHHATRVLSTSGTAHQELLEALEDGLRRDR
jgi:hypothetical protein